MTETAQPSSSISPKEALERAKEIAARYASQSTTAATNIPGSTAISQTTTTSTTNTLKTSGKRKRWGVAPSDEDEAADVEQKRQKAAAIAATLSAALPAAGPSTASLSNNNNSEPILQRVWIKTNKERPARHFVEFLQDKLHSVVVTLWNDDTNNNNNNSADSQKNDGKKKSLEITLAGRGAPGEAPTPGMPQQPLHVLIQGPNKAVVEQAETSVEILLQQAEQAPVTVELNDDDNEENGDGSKRHSTLATALAVVGSSYYGSSRGSTYRPASVAQLIGQANNPAAAGALAGGGLDDTSQWIEELVQVPNGVVGYIIGRGGENITSMQAKTGAKVQIQKEHELQPGQAMRTITLSASNQMALDECRSIILNMVQEKTATLGGGNISQLGNKLLSKDERLLQQALAAGHEHIQMKVPDADVGLIIGKQGSTIRSIQDQSGANIQVPPSADPSNSADASAVPTRTVHITHPTLQGAQHAQQLIQNILDSKPSFASAGAGPATAVQQTTIQVSVPDKDVGLCIGRQGCVIREMQNRTKTRIQIPPHAAPGEMHRVISLTGSQEGCLQVQQMIQSIVAAQSSAPVMSGTTAGYRGPGQQQASYYGQQQHQQQQPDVGSQHYSADWAAYHAAQAAAQQQQQQQQQQQYAAQVAAATAQAASTAQQPKADAYYEDFFRYSYYYGEEAARKQYGAWSPPVGTPNPYGVNPNIQPVPASDPAPAAAATTVAAPAPAATTAHAPTSAMQNAPVLAEARETSRRKVSNLPAWMTKT